MRCEMLIVDAGESVLVKVGVLAAVIQPRLVVDADNVGILGVGNGETGIGKEPEMLPFLKYSNSGPI